MSTKSDFAQKLLHDLRLRKERMAAHTNSTTQMSRASAAYGNSGKTSKGAQQMKTLASQVASRTGNTGRMSNGSSRAINIKESSNQIVLYDTGQVRDLSMAISFAFENGASLGKIEGSTTNPLLNFLSRFGRRSMDSQRMDITNFHTQALSFDQLPNMSHIHISEISKGVQKLNQILRACSSGINFDHNSIEVGKELLRGAIDLEESLRMLVNLPKYANGTQAKSRLKLLDEDEDEDDNDKEVDQWKLDRPRFSFDKTRRKQSNLVYPDQSNNNSKMVLHTRSTSYVQDLSLSIPTSSHSTEEKGRISNVIAKLMGLEEIPLKEDSTRHKNDSRGKHGKVSRRLPDDLNRQNRNGTPTSADKKSTSNNYMQPTRGSKVERNRDIPDGSRVERNQLHKDSKMQATGSEAEAGKKLTDRKKSHPNTAPIQVTGVQSFDYNAKTEDKESQVNRNESRMLALHTEIQHKVPKSRTLRPEGKTQNKIEYKLTSNSMEKRNVDKELTDIQQDQGLLHVHVPKRKEHSDDNPQLEQKRQQIQKITKKQEVHLNAAKSKKSAATNLQKKLPHDALASVGEKPMRPTEKVTTTDSQDKRHQGAAPSVDISKKAATEDQSHDMSQKTASSQETLEKENQSRNSSPRQPQVNVKMDSSKLMLTEERSTEVRTRKVPAAILRKGQKGENPRKIDELMTRRTATVNHLARSRKQADNIFKDLKQQMHQNKNKSSKRMEKRSDGKVKEERTSISVENTSGMTTELERQHNMLQNEAEILISNSYVVGEGTAAQTDTYDGAVLNVEQVSDVLQTVHQPCAPKDEEIHKESDQTEKTELYMLSQPEFKQFRAWSKHEQLTEPEKDLKEILIKSHLFLSTAEALFKLNIHVSFLHASDHETEVTTNKPVLDSAHEVMKRKARRHEVSLHPYTKSMISNTKVRSLDDLVKQLCKDLEMLKCYGHNGDDECDVATSLHAMLTKDIYDNSPDINSMWDFEWSKLTSMIPEKDGVVRDVERQTLDGLLDEITNDLLLVTVTV